MNATSLHCLDALVAESDPNPNGGNDGHGDDHHPCRIVDEVGIRQEHEPAPKLKWAALSFSVHEKDESDTADQ